LPNGSRGLNPEILCAADNFKCNFSSRIKVISIIQVSEKNSNSIFQKNVLSSRLSRLD